MVEDGQISLFPSRAMVLKTPRQSVPATMDVLTNSSSCSPEMDTAHDLAESADGNLDADLLAEISGDPGLPVEIFDEVAYATASRTIIVVRQRDGVAYSTLFAILAALLIDGLLLGGLFLLHSFHWDQHVVTRSSRGHAMNDGSTAIGGIVWKGAGNGAAASVQADSWRSPALPAPPELPPSKIWHPHVSGSALLADNLADPQKKSIIGVLQGAHAWLAPRPSAVKLPRSLTARPTPKSAPVMPDRGISTSRGRDQNHRSRGPKGVSRSNGGGGGWLGPPVSMYKGEARSHGDFSATGGIESNGQQKFPVTLKRLLNTYALMGEKVQLSVRVLVLSDGSVKKVTIVKSSGHRMLDKLFQSAILNWKYIPKRIKGVPTSGHFEETFKFTPP